MELESLVVACSLHVVEALVLVRQSGDDDAGSGRAADGCRVIADPRLRPSTTPNPQSCTHARLVRHSR